jgi:hypothetical protein
MFDIGYCDRGIYRARDHGTGSTVCRWVCHGEGLRTMISRPKAINRQFGLIMKQATCNSYITIMKGELGELASVLSVWSTSYATQSGPEPTEKSIVANQ